MPVTRRGGAGLVCAVRGRHAGDRRLFTDAAGRRVNLPDHIRRILPAERNAEVLVYALAPDKLVGLERLSGGKAKLRGIERPPVLHFRQDSTPESVAQAAFDYRADVIVGGPVTS